MGLWKVFYVCFPDFVFQTLFWQVAYRGRSCFETLNHFASNSFEALKSFVSSHHQITALSVSLHKADFFFL